MRPGHVAVLGKQNVASLAAEHDRLAKQGEGGAVDIAPDDHREAAPKSRVRRPHDLRTVLERLRWGDHLETEQLLADPEDVTRLESLLARNLQEDPVEALQITDRDPLRSHRKLGMPGGEVGVGVEQRSLPAANDIFALMQRMGASLGA